MATLVIPASAGVRQACAETTISLPFNSIAAVEKAFAERGAQIAAVIVEPAMMNIGFVLPEDEYLAGLEEIAHKQGAVAIFDEVKT